MNRDDIAYVVESCRRTFYLLDLHFTLLHKYCPDIQWPIYVICREKAHYSQRANLYEKYPGVKEIDSLGEIPSYIQYICMTKDFVFLKSRPILENIIEGCGPVCFIRRESNIHHECLRGEMSQNLYTWSYDEGVFVGGSLHKWVRELALQEGVFLDEGFS
jgi:hypothetical protein